MYMSLIIQAVLKQYYQKSHINMILLKQLTLSELFIRRLYTFFPQSMVMHAVRVYLLNPSIHVQVYHAIRRRRAAHLAPRCPGLPASVRCLRDGANINFWPFLWTGTVLIKERPRCSSPLISQLIAPPLLPRVRAREDKKRTRSPHDLHSNRALQGRARMQYANPKGSCSSRLPNMFQLCKLKWVRFNIRWT